MVTKFGKTDQPANRRREASESVPPDAAGVAPTMEFRQPRRLIALANELLNLAAEIENGPDQVREPKQSMALAGDDVRWLTVARKAYRDRRNRDAMFGDEALFGEPAWDLLLDLFIAAKEGKRMPVTSACIGAAVPTTTALRWLTVLEQRGLILREADPNDARRIFVRLSADAYARMVAYFSRIADDQPAEPEPDQS